jgi:hypothetical protein
MLPFTFILYNTNFNANIVAFNLYEESPNSHNLCLQLVYASVLSYQNNKMMQKINSNILISLFDIHTVCIWFSDE